MPISVLQESSADNSIALPNASITMTFTAGSTIIVGAFGANPISGVSTNKDGSLGAPKQTSPIAAGRSLYAFVQPGVVGGSTIVTATWPGAGGAIWVAEIGTNAGSTAVYESGASSIPLNPGTGVDAISSGNVTPTYNPALIFALCARLGAAGAVTQAGTGFTAGATGWTFGGVARGRSENLRVTTNTPIPGTFTNTTDGASTQYFVIAVALAESALPAPIAWVVG